MQHIATHVMHMIDNVDAMTQNAFDDNDDIYDEITIALLRVIITHDYYMQSLTTRDIANIIMYVYHNLHTCYDDAIDMIKSIVQYIRNDELRDVTNMLINTFDIDDAITQRLLSMCDDSFNDETNER